ncbi:MAG: hypothetical protein K6G17_01630 [Oscillospiraceae bacterium]|nr:hypothetical protein [Oscillospiraceae bacterium]
MSVLLGMLGALIGAGLFISGVLVGRGLFPAAPTPEAAIEPAEEQAEREAERERLRQDQAAFHELLGYNAAVAYGLGAAPGKD